MLNAQQVASVQYTFVELIKVSRKLEAILSPGIGIEGEILVLKWGRQTLVGLDVRFLGIDKSVVEII